MTWDVDLDASGLLCPLPVLKARKCLLAMQSGQVLRMTATDPMARIDIPHFCQQSGDTLLFLQDDADVIVFLIRKGQAKD